VKKSPQPGFELAQPCTQAKAGTEAAQATWQAASHMPLLFGFRKVLSTYGNSASYHCPDLFWVCLPGAR